MNQAKLEAKKEQKKLRRKKKNALIICRNGKEFWTTQDQFRQWVRENVVANVRHNPLRGEFIKENEETAVVLANTILNLAHRTHLHEALYSRKFRVS